VADKSLEGYEFPPYMFEVERVKIREFLTAIGDDNPVFLSKDTAQKEGYADTPCPPTFFTCAMQEFTGAYFTAFERLGVSLNNMLHGEEAYDYLGEIYPGDVLSCTMKIESIVEKQTKSGSMDLITLQTKYTNQRNEEILQSRSVWIERK